MPSPRHKWGRAERRYRRHLPGVEVARATSTYDSWPYAKMTWAWSLRGDGRVFCRLTCTEYYQPKLHDDASDRDYILTRPHGPEPVLWEYHGRIPAASRSRAADGEVTLQELLEAGITNAGHFLPGTQPERRLADVKPAAPRFAANGGAVRLRAGASGR